jgi:drug/metabolite transporter (DMT)-like permease
MSQPASGRALQLTAFLTLLLIALMMASNHIAARLAFNHGVDVATAVASRSLITALVVIAIVSVNRVSWRPNRQQARGLLLVGLMIGVQSQCLYSAVARLPVALALLAFNTYPLWTALWDRVIYKNTPERSVLLAMPVIVVGLTLALDVVGVLGGHAQLNAAQLLPGVGFALAAAATFGLALVWTQHETEGVDGRVRTASTMVMAGCMALVVIASQGGPHWPTAGLGWLGLGLLTFLYGTAFTIMFIVLPRLGVAGNSAIMNAEPVFSLVLAWLILGQNLSMQQVLGCLIVVGSVMWLGLRKRR